MTHAPATARTQGRGGATPPRSRRAVRAASRGGLPWASTWGAVLGTLWGLAGCGSSWSPADANLSSYHPGDASAPVACKVDADCAQVPRGPCDVPACDEAAGHCVLRAVTDGTPCTTGDACVVGQRCQAGECRGGEPRPPCVAVQCGVDACGHDCGACQGAMDCVDGVCEARACPDSTYAGCCLASGALRYCDMGSTRVVECGAGGAEPGAAATCGWAAGVGLFDCVAQPGPAPDGGYLCPGEACAPEPCAGRECGWACGQACGTCGDGERCDGGVCVACGCGGRVCGDDGCGASCGTCPAGEACVDGACVDACGPVGSAGCCQGDTLRYCDDGALVTQVCDEEAEGGASCGWRLEDGWYGCGGVGADPAGGHPRGCEELLPAEPEPEPGPEPGPEPVPETGSEPGPEPGVEVIPDAPGDESQDAAADAGVADGGLDGGVEAGGDSSAVDAAGPDLEPDVDAGADTSPEPDPDAGSDAGPDGGPDGGPDAG